ncbi:hypothetical protein D3C78_1065780 [compost metagenome]
MLTNCPITVITLYGYCFLSQIDHLLRRTKSNDLGYLWVSQRIAMRHTHSAAYTYVKSDKLAFLNNRDKTKILRENIYIIGRRNRNTDFKLTRQIYMAVDRLLLLFIILTVQHLFAIKPYFMIRSRLRLKMTAQLAGPFKHLRMDFRLIRIGVAHNITIDVTASS